MLTPKSYKGHAADQRPNMHTHTAALSSHLLGVHICRSLRSALRAALLIILGLGYPEPMFSFARNTYPTLSACHQEKEAGSSLPFGSDNLQLRFLWGRMSRSAQQALAQGSAKTKVVRRWIWIAHLPARQTRHTRLFHILSSEFVFKII